MSVSQMSVSQMSISQMSVNQMSVSYISVGQTFVSQISVDQMSLFQMPLFQMSVSQISAGYMSVGQMSVAQKSTSQMSIGQMILGQKMWNLAFVLIQLQTLCQCCKNLFFFIIYILTKAARHSAKWRIREWHTSKHCKLYMNCDIQQHSKINDINSVCWMSLRQY